MQQVFLKVIGEAHKYEITYFKSWLYTVARNHCLMQLRGRKFTQHIDRTDSPADDAPGVDQIEKEKTLLLLETAVAQLGGDQQSCIRLFYLEQKSYLQIAEALHISVMQVKSHIQNGKRNLRIYLEKHRGHE